jgi:hypothetical protein
MMVDQQALVTGLLSAKGDDLQDWELDFLDSLDRQRKRDLSEAELEALRSIADRVGLAA